MTDVFSNQIAMEIEDGRKLGHKRAWDGLQSPLCIQ